MMKKNQSDAGGVQAAAAAAVRKAGMRRRPARDSSHDAPRSPVRVMRIMQALAMSAEPLSLAKLTERLRLPKSSLLNLLRSLEQASYIAFASGAYVLGPESFKIGAAITAKDRLVVLARPTLLSLAEITGETTQLGVLASDEPMAVCVDMVESKNPHRFAVSVGLRRPLYCTSIGKLFLAHQPEEWRKRYFAETEFLRYTARTPTKKCLAVELKEIRCKAISISHGSMFDGASGMSAPVWNAENRMIAGVSIAAPTTRMQPNEERFRKALSAAAAEVSRLIGHTNDSRSHDQR